MTSQSPGLRNQAEMRTNFPVLGLVLVAAGLTLVVLGMMSFFSSMNTFEPPDRFWMAFVGLPLVGVGGWILYAGFGQPPARGCAECSKTNADDARFCAACGTALV